MSLSCINLYYIKLEYFIFSLQIRKTFYFAYVLCYFRLQQTAIKKWTPTTKIHNFKIKKFIWINRNYFLRVWMCFYFCIYDTKKKFVSMALTVNIKKREKYKRVRLLWKIIRIYFSHWIFNYLKSVEIKKQWWIVFSAVKTLFCSKSLKGIQVHGKQLRAERNVYKRKVCHSIFDIAVN